MRILFAGTPALAVPSLEKAAHAHEVVGVLTSPDQPSGRGRAPVPSPVKEAAGRLGLRVLQPEKLDAAFLEEVRALAPDALVVAAFGRIFRKALLDLFPLGGINVHPSLLPRHRGRAAVEWTIKEGDPIAGGTVYHLAERMDAGAIAAQDWCFVRKGERARELWERALAPLGLRLLGEVIEHAKTKGSLPARPQDEQFATKAPSLVPH